MIRLTQPPGTYLCGQTCLAMLAGISIERAITIIGHGHSTRTRELVTAFRALGFICPDRLRRFGRTVIAELDLAVVKVCYSGCSRTHWIAVSAGEIYDPVNNSLLYGRTTSYLPLTPPTRPGEI